MKDITEILKDIELKEQADGFGTKIGKAITNANAVTTKLRQVATNAAINGIGRSISNPMTIASAPFFFTSEAGRGSEIVDPDFKKKYLDALEQHEKQKKEMGSSLVSGGIEPLPSDHPLIAGQPEKKYRGPEIGGQSREEAITGLYMQAAKDLGDVYTARAVSSPTSTDYWQSTRSAPFALKRIETDPSKARQEYEQSKGELERYTKDTTPKPEPKDELSPELYSKEQIDQYNKDYEEYVKSFPKPESYSRDLAGLEAEYAGNEIFYGGLNAALVAAAAAGAGSLGSRRATKEPETEFVDILARQYEPVSTPKQLTTSAPRTSRPALEGKPEIKGASDPRPQLKMRVPATEIKPETAIVKRELRTAVPSEGPDVTQYRTERVPENQLFGDPIPAKHHQHITPEEHRQMQVSRDVDFMKNLFDTWTMAGKKVTNKPTPPKALPAPSQTIKPSSPPMLESIKIKSSILSEKFPPTRVPTVPPRPVMPPVVPPRPAPPVPRPPIVPKPIVPQPNVPKPTVPKPIVPKPGTPPSPPVPPSQPPSPPAPGTPKEPPPFTPPSTPPVEPQTPPLIEPPKPEIPVEPVTPAIPPQEPTIPDVKPPSFPDQPSPTIEPPSTPKHIPITPKTEPTPTEVPTSPSVTPGTSPSTTPGTMPITTPTVSPTTKSLTDTITDVMLQTAPLVLPAIGVGSRVGQTVSNAIRTILNPSKPSKTGTDTDDTSSREDPRLALSNPEFVSGNIDPVTIKVQSNLLKDLSSGNINQLSAHDRLENLGYLANLMFGKPRPNRMRDDD